MKKNKNIFEVIEDSHPPLLKLLEQLKNGNRQLELKIAVNESGLQISAGSHNDTLAAIAVALFSASQNLAAMKMSMPKMITDDFIMQLTFAYHLFAKDSMKI